MSGIKTSWANGVNERKSWNILRSPDEFHGPVLSYVEEENWNKGWKCGFSQRVLWKFGSSNQNNNVELEKEVFSELLQRLYGPEQKAESS